MQKKKVKTINSKWLAFSILNELFFRKDVKSSDYEVFTIVLRKIIDTNSKRVIISQNDFISSSRTVRRVVPYLKGIDVIDFENTFISKDSTKQGFNRYWINEKFLEDDEYIYKINWSKLK
jgi:predicted GNAT family acetyltransferase